MSEYKRPLPVVTDYTKPFWEAASRGELLVQRCRKCGFHIWYPRPSCPRCGSLELEWAKSSGLGTVYSYTVIRRVVANSPDFQRDIPFVVAEVDLDEGVRLYGRLDVKPEDARTGMRVRVEFEKVTPDIALYKFRPV